MRSPHPSRRPTPSRTGGPDVADPPGSGLDRRALLAGGLATGAALAFGAFAKPAAAFLPPAPTSEVHIRPITFPVVGRVTWTDTYLAPRSGGRLHEGCDLMGTKMQKLVAAVTGTIVELRHRSDGGGNAIYLRGDDGWYYCYLHINNDRPGTDDGSNLYGNAFAPGIKAGVRVGRGQHIAYLGDSGNAEATGAHLHFEIRKPNARWYDAAAVNPTYSLQRATPAIPQVPLSTFRPFPDAAAFMRQATLDAFDRPISSSGLVEWTKKLNQGVESPESTIRWLMGRPECWYVHGAVARIHLAIFDRWPDRSLLDFVRARRNGSSLQDIAAWLLNGPDAQRRFGGPDDEFISTVFQRTRNRQPTAAEWQQWRGLLANGGRAAVLVLNAESDEAKWVLHHKSLLIMSYAVMLRRGPGPTTAAGWLAKIQAGGWDELLKAIRLSQEYANRF